MLRAKGNVAPRHDGFALHSLGEDRRITSFTAFEVFPLGQISALRMAKLLIYWAVGQRDF
jgi:hypothetical protein